MWHSPNGADTSVRRILDFQTVLGRSSMYAYIRAGTFPKPVKLGLRASAWVKSEILAWVQGRIEQGH